MSKNGEEDEEPEEEELEGFVDFTVATPWERFTASVEGLLRQWQSIGHLGLLENGQGKPLEGHSGVAYVEGEVPHGPKSYRLTFYFPDPTLDETPRGPEAHTDTSEAKGPCNPWEAALHPLQLWFGIKDFMVIAPMTLSGVVLDSPEASMLLSSLSIASSNADLSIPAFVPVHDPTRKAFVGFQHGPRNPLHGGSDYSCNFEADRLGSHVPQNLLNLDGLYYLFAFKIIAELPSTVASVSPDVTVSMRISYRIRYWGARRGQARRKREDLETLQAVTNLNKLVIDTGDVPGNESEEGDGEGDEYWAAENDQPWDEEASWSNWHSVDDPVKGFEVVAIWKELHASSSSGMAQIEQLDATWADEWRLRALLVPVEDSSYEDDAPGFSGRLHCMLGAYVVSSTAPYIEDFIQAQGVQQQRAKLSIPSPSVMERVINDLFNPPPPSQGMASMEEASRGGEEASSSGRKLVPLSSLRKREQEARQLPTELGEEGEQLAAVKGKVNFSGKAAPPESLFGRFALHALCFGTCNIRSICALWLEFCRELRWHWEEVKLLPSIPAIPGPPNTAACLVHQKLQLLQECIRRQQQQQQRDLDERMKQAQMMHRIAAAKLVGERVDELVKGTAFDDTKSEEEEEDEEASDGEERTDRRTVPLSERSTGEGESSSSSNGVHPSMQLPRKDGRERAGAKGPVTGDLWLLSVKRRMFAPHTQDPVFMTEDMIEEKERALEMLGETPAGREARARLQGDILASDMAAFKAANPGAVLEDFVRWYSPQDWVETEEGSDGQSSVSSKSSRGAQSLFGEKEDQHPSGAWPPKGQLSERMLHQEGNLWQELWEDTEPEPAHEQRPIFHFSLEGEKILHYFDTLVPEALLSQLLCVAFSTACHVLGESEGAEVRSVASQRRKVEAMIRSMWEWPDDQAPGNCTDERVEDMEVLFSAFEKMEGSVLAAASLWRRLQGSYRLVEALMTERATGVDIPCASLLPARLSTDNEGAGDEWETVGNLFSSQQPETGPSQGSWVGNRMGNLLLGHEPFEREVIFTSPAFAVYRGSKGSNQATIEDSQESESARRIPEVEVVKHQLYAKGSLDYLTLALRIASQD